MSEFLSLLFRTITRTEAFNQFSIGRVGHIPKNQAGWAFETSCEVGSLVLFLPLVVLGEVLEFEQKGFNAGAAIKPFSLDRLSPGWCDAGSPDFSFGLR